MSRSVVRSRAEQLLLLLTITCVNDIMHGSDNLDFTILLSI